MPSFLEADAQRSYALEILFKPRVSMKPAHAAKQEQKEKGRRVQR